MSLETKKRGRNIFIFKHFDSKEGDEAIMTQRVTNSEINWKRREKTIEDKSSGKQNITTDNAFKFVKILVDIKERICQRFHEKLVRQNKILDEILQLHLANSLVKLWKLDNNLEIYLNSWNRRNIETIM